MNEQHELYENARNCVKRKKRLYVHFILFVTGSLFFVIANKLLKYGDTYDWYIGAIAIWFFFWVLHCINVYITKPFMGKEWERRQTEKLVLKQEKKIAQLEKEMADEALLKTESEQYTRGLERMNKPSSNNSEE